jgi:uncharacterized protein YndB with AHSA1/START domain
MILTPVVKTVTVAVPRERAFAFFVERFGEWWPMEGHRINESSTAATLEPREGGRWFEHGPDGECLWGHVLAYEPPERLLLAWQLNEAWTYDPDFSSEVEIRFTSVDGGTRVDLEHRDMDRFNEQVRASFDGEGGWSGILAAYEGLLSEGRP